MSLEPQFSFLYSRDMSSADLIVRNCTKHCNSCSCLMHPVLFCRVEGNVYDINAVTLYSAPLVSAAFPLVQFLEVLQDYSMHLCLTDRADGAKPQGLTHHPHLMGHPLHLSGERESLSCRLYHSHSVISAILSARQLVTNAGKKLHTPLSATRPPQIDLSKQDNSGKFQTALHYHVIIM